MLVELDSVVDRVIVVVVVWVPDSVEEEVVELAVVEVAVDDELVVVLVLVDLWVVVTTIGGPEPVDVVCAWGLPEEVVLVILGAEVVVLDVVTWR